MADEQVIVDIQVDSKDVEAAKKDIDGLTDSIEELGKVISNAREHNKQYKKTIADLDKQLKDGKLSTESHRKQTKLLNEEIKKNNISIAKSTVELSKQKRERKANINLISSEKNAYDALSAKLNLARKSAKNLGVQFGTNSKQFKTAAAGVQQLDSKLKKIDNSLGQNQRSVGKYSNALKGLAGQLIGGLGISAAVALVISQFKKMAERAGVLIKSVNRLKGTFDITTREAKKLASQINAIATNVDDVDTKALEISLNAIVKTFDDLSEQEALDLIQEGFSKGSNNSGEFLDILREYPLFFKKAGLSASEMFAIINQQVKEGVYSDKGVDAIKEATIQLTENTKIVKDALRPLGESVNLQIRQKVEAGKAFEAMQLISKEMKKLGVNSSEAQTIMADVFKGAGEDSDNFVRNLHNVNLSLDDVESQTSIVTRANIELSESYNNFVLSVDSGKGTISKAVASLTDMASGMLKTLTIFSETDIENKLKIIANAALGLLETAFLPLVKILRVLGVKIPEFRFEIENTSDVLDENTKSIKENVKVEETSIEKKKKLDQQLKINAKNAEKIRKQEAKDIEDVRKRNESANEKLIELDNKRRIANLENAEKIKDERIKIEAETSARLILNEDLTAKEKELIIQQSIYNIAKINKEFEDSEIKKQEEKTERIEAANETIQELNEELALSQIEGAEQLKDKLIEFEKAKVKILLDDETLLAEEKEAIRLQSETNIKAIEDEFADEKKEKDKEDLEQRKEFLQNYFVDLIAITGRFAGEELAIFGKMALGISQAFEDGKITAEGAIQAVGMISNALFDNIAERRDNDLSNNEKARAKELELAEGNEEAQAAINEKFDKIENKIKLKQFEDDKKRALVDIVIATALAVAKAGILTFQGIATGIAGIALFAKVAATKPPKFAGGASDIVNIGGSHASGNDTDVWGYSGGKKQYFGKVEKGEAMPVIRKSAVNDYEVAKLNGRFNSSRGKRFAGGTPDITDEGGGQNNEVFVGQLANAFSNINIVAKIEDITKEAGKKIEIVDNSKV